MLKYLITSKHDESECLQALDEMLDKGPKVLDTFVFGCKEGDHTAYALVEKKSLSDALSLVPDFLQERACITKVDKYTPAEIRSFHTKAA